MDENSSHESKLQKELAYYKKQLDKISGESIQHDFILSSLRHELKQKKEALSILSSLQKNFSVTTPLHTIYIETVKAINMQLSMDYSLILIPQLSNVYKASHWFGFQDEQQQVLQTGEVEIPANFCKPGQYLLLNKATPISETTSQIQKNFSLMYFAGVPLLLNEKPIAFIISGRKFEKMPFVPPLDMGDTDTLTAIAGLISMIIQNKNVMELKVQKAEVEKQREAITVQRDKLEQALIELKNAQAQLIQSEKMASLGELTAGIAHEIQNPLNFVNNFSEVNNELVDELKAELAIGNVQLAIGIADDIKDNEEKINHHGKRADAIVKSMLQHSKQTKGVKEPSDINALCDEYLRLSYHGMRAKDKDFNADFKTDFDETIGKINVVPQDIGRALLNLYNNAFYAVNERKRIADESYKPLVSVQTKKINNNIKIKVTDNGNGIRQNIIEKILQPFFTTKPTGQGTGLGLSLAYDIITKEHNGVLNVESTEGEGSEFIIRLPINI